MRWAGRGFMFGAGLMVAIVALRPTGKDVRTWAHWLESYASWLDDADDQVFERQGRILRKHLREES